jgi:hypothetical protein
LGAAGGEQPGVQHGSTWRTSQHGDQSAWGPVSMGTSQHGVQQWRAAWGEERMMQPIVQPIVQHREQPASLQGNSTDGSMECNPRRITDSKQPRVQHGVQPREEHTMQPIVQHGEQPASLQENSMDGSMECNPRRITDSSQGCSMECSHGDTHDAADSAAWGTATEAAAGPAWVQPGVQQARVQHGVQEHMMQPIVQHGEQPRK